MLREKISFSVSSDAFPGNALNVAGWLSVPPKRTMDALLILIHGGVYTHAYWDMPYKPEIYSCVQWAYERGISTLNLDRLGNGESSHPSGKELTLAVHAESLKQIIDAVRSEGVLGHRFKRLITVGHSMGSLTAGLTQATYGNADAVVLTGLTGVNVVDISDRPESVEGMLTMFRPVSEEPLFDLRSGQYDEDYYCMPLSTRKRMFFHIPSVEQEIIDLDFNTQGTQTLGESQSCGMAYDSILRMQGPVLVEMGEFDTFFMGSETTGFKDANLVRDASRAHAEAIAKAPANFTVADMFKNCGHNLAQHPNAHQSYEVMVKWICDLGF